MRLVALALFTALLAPAAFAAPVPKHLIKEAETDKAKLQGQWKVDSIRMGGQDVLAALGQQFDFVIEFSGDAFTATANIAGTVQKTTATVAYGTDKRVQMTNQRTADGNGKPDAGPKDGSFGYALDGDKLLLASTADGQKTADPLKPGPNDMVITLTRVKQ